MSLDDDRYEVFLPHHTASKHRIMAITGFPGHPQLLALATVSNATAARRLADALNSHLLGRRNHVERLDESLIGLPESVVATVRQLPIKPAQGTHLGRARLADHLHGDPIDGILMFPTTSCASSECVTCGNCVDDCQDCEICEEGACVDCVRPDLTPRTARVLAAAGSILADQYFDHAEELNAGHPCTFGEIVPAIMRKQPVEFFRRMARIFDDLTDDLQDGVEPRPLDMSEQIALDLMIQEAEVLFEDPDVIDSFVQGLPETRYDYDFNSLYDALFEDMDHIGLLSSKNGPNAPGELEFLFEPFYDGEQRDPNRGFRR
ncbi:hypothetical protein [Amycolatopsis sp. SID8362]|uniref:hypothetical protein n=1 Tax=Amycolatopsis sp. SID8362 TaxID=2690346 RepID=UPI00136A511E|nr:hypothetical protein [Amycolatopsis sp. SID8362]NBH10345.1 hypothetical protein [Amycolatopsis sp. SID8362]NED47040.1 hypothetical protein [Amycolatopsis sp. SID8362]